MRKLTWFFVAALTAALSVITIALPAASAAEFAERTLTSGDVSVTGNLEESATLIVTVSPYTESALAELVKRKQVSDEKSIISVYDIQVMGNRPEEPQYRVVIKNVRLSQFVKNKISVIDKNGAYHAISDFDYVNKAVSFESSVLGQVVIYKDATVLYIVIASAGVVLLLILITKVFAAQRYQELKAGAHASRKPARERDKRYW